jgi:hypothetical protein
MSTPEQAPGAIRFSPENVARLLAELRDRDSCDFDRAEWCEPAADLIDQLQADVVRLTGERDDANRHFEDQEARIVQVCAERDAQKESADCCAAMVSALAGDVQRLEAQLREARVQAFRAGRSSRFLARGWTFEKMWTGQDRRAEAAYLASLEAKEPTP